MNTTDDTPTSTPEPVKSRPRTGPIVWGTLMLALCAWVAQRTLFPDAIEPGVWIAAIVLGLGLLLLVVGTAVAFRRR